MKTKTTKHTPGPWTYQDSTQTVFSKHEDHKFSLIAKIATGEDRAEEDANALLIAAAPELLEALQKLGQETAPFIATAIGSRNPNILAAVQKANEAIAKATGETL